MLIKLLLLSQSSVQVAALAFLHYLVMLGSTVMLASIIVPQMGGNAVSIHCLVQQLPAFTHKFNFLVKV